MHSRLVSHMPASMVDECRHPRLLRRPAVLGARRRNLIWLRAALFPSACIRLYRRTIQYRLLRRLCQTKKCRALGPDDRFSDKLLAVLFTLAMFAGQAWADPPDLVPRAPAGWESPLVVKPLGYDIPNAPIGCEDIVSINFAIANMGDTDADPFLMELWDITERTLLFRTFSRELPANQCFLQDLRWSFINPGPHELLLLADSHQSIPQEPNETNNEYLKTIQVLANEELEIITQGTLGNPFPIYIQNEYERFAYEWSSGVTGMDLALADILGYWDRYADHNGVICWTLIPNGVAPLIDDFPMASGHTLGAVYETVYQLSWLHYQQKETVDRTLERYSGACGLQFNAQRYTDDKAYLWNIIKGEIDRGQPAIATTRRIGSEFQTRAMPVIGYRIIRQDDIACFQVLLVFNDPQCRMQAWVNWYGGDTADLDIVEVYTVVPGGGPGLPTDVYESQNWSYDDDYYNATPIDPDHTYAFRQTHNFGIKIPDFLQDDRQDWVKFDARAGETYTIETEALGDECDTVLALYFGTTFVASDDNSGDDGRSSRIVWSCKQDRTAHVQITDRNGNTGPDTKYDICITSHSGYGGGRGTPHRPYVISTARHLWALSKHPEDWNKHFALLHNINLAAYSEETFSFIGTAAHPFSGTFNGHHCTISNFDFLPTDNGGFGPFGAFSEGTRVIDLRTVNPTIESP